MKSTWSYRLRRETSLVAKLRFCQPGFLMLAMLGCTHADRVSEEGDVSRLQAALEGVNRSEPASSVATVLGASGVF